MTEREYNQCVDLYADQVYRFIVKNLRHEEDARDVVQTAFEKLWRCRGEVDMARSRSYLFTIAYNQMIDHIRKIRRISLRDEFGEGSGVTEQPEASLRKVLDEAVSRLNDTQRSLVMLKDKKLDNPWRKHGNIPL